MEALATRRVWTDEEIMALPKDGNRYELVDGELTTSPAGARHGDINVLLASRLAVFVNERKSGRVLDSSTGFRMTRGNIRCPDVSFVSRERIIALGALPRGFFEGAPDLAIEVLSPSDTMDSLRTRLVDYFESGCRLAWVVNPDEKSALVYRSPQPERLLKGTDSLDGEDVVPGFSLSLSELLEEPSF
jgi:Uma2 family endonuclease